MCPSVLCFYLDHHHHLDHRDVPQNVPSSWWKFVQSKWGHRCWWEALVLYLHMHLISTGLAWCSCFMWQCVQKHMWVCEPQREISPACIEYGLSTRHCLLLQVEYTASWWSWLSGASEPWECRTIIDWLWEAGGKWAALSHPPGWDVHTELQYSSPSLCPCRSQW